MKQKINLVLTCGYARCFAQIGAIRLLQQSEVEVNSITAVGFGSFIAALICAGYPIDKVADFFLSTKPQDYCHSNRETNTGLFTSSEFLKRIQQKLGSLRFGNLKLPLVLVLHDLTKGKTVEVKDGPLSDVLAEENTYPLLYDFGPNQNMVNGKILSPLPVAIARTNFGGPIWAIDTESQHQRPIQNILIDTSPWAEALTAVNPILWILGRKKVSRLELRVLEMIKTTTIDWIIQDEKPDVLLRLEDHPESRFIHQDDFQKVDKLILLGEEIAQNYLKDIAKE